jgi:hypothetical protein
MRQLPSFIYTWSFPHYLSNAGMATHTTNKKQGKGGKLILIGQSRQMEIVLAS